MVTGTGMKKTNWANSLDRREEMEPKWGHDLSFSSPYQVFPPAAAVSLTGSRQMLNRLCAASWNAWYIDSTGCHRKDHKHNAKGKRGGTEIFIWFFFPTLSFSSS